MAVLGRPPAALADQSFVVMGAGSAGMGVVRMVAQVRPPFVLDDAALAPLIVSQPAAFRRD